MKVAFGMNRIVLEIQGYSLSLDFSFSCSFSSKTKIFYLPGKNYLVAFSTSRYQYRFQLWVGKIFFEKCLTWTCRKLTFRLLWQFLPYHVVLYRQEVTRNLLFLSHHPCLLDQMVMTSLLHTGPWNLSWGFVKNLEIRLPMSI
jgi:hypothetical protein